MKRLLLLLSLALLSSPSFSQKNSTETPSDSSYGITKAQLAKDSLVVIPKTIALWLAQDAHRARSYEHEIQLLNEVIGMRESVLMKQDTIIESYKAKVRSCVTTSELCSDLNREYEFEIIGLKKELTKQTNRKRFWRTAAFILPVVVGTIIYSNH